MQRDINRDHQQAMIGRTVEVLVEGRPRRPSTCWPAATPSRPPEIDGLTYVNDGVAYPGELVSLEITDAGDYDLVGRVVGRDETRARQKLPAARKPRAEEEAGAHHPALKVT